MKTRIQAVRVKTRDGYTTYTRAGDGLDAVSVAETNVLILRKENGDAVAMYNPLAWENLEAEWEEV